MTNYPYSSTTAAEMLATGLRSAASERRLSSREIGRRLGYSQAVVLSHMANGRVPIPLDRAPDIAREVGLPLKQFLEAVLEQRHPTIDWSMLQAGNDPLVRGLEELAGKPLSALGPKYEKVLSEVVRDPDPEARWLSIPELRAVAFLRDHFPNMRTDGLNEDEKEIVRLSALVVRNPDTKDDGEREALQLAADLRHAEDATPSHQQSTRRSKKNEC